MNEKTVAYVLSAVGLFVFSVAMLWWLTSALQKREIKRRRADRARLAARLEDCDPPSPHPGLSCDSKCDLTDRTHGYGGYFIGESDTAIQDRVETALSIANATWQPAWTNPTEAFRAEVVLPAEPEKRAFRSITATRGVVKPMSAVDIPELIDLEPVSGEVLSAPIPDEPLPAWIDDLDAGVDEVMADLELRLIDCKPEPVVVAADDTITFTLSAGTVDRRAVGSVRMASAADDVQRARRFELDPLGSWYVDRSLEQPSIFDQLAAEFKFLSVPAGELASV